MTKTADIEWQIAPGPIEYPDAMALMEHRVRAIREGAAREMVWLLEHPPLYTAGTSAKAGDLLERRFPVFEAGRGGQFTYHGPGQRIGYVMLDLKKRDAMDVRRYVQTLERWLVDTLAHFGVTGHIRQGRVGVWVEHGGRESKIAALGIRIRGWVTYHGISLNVNPDLSHYSGIVPCGIEEFGVTSLAQLGVSVTQAELDSVLQSTFTSLFGGSGGGPAL